MINNFSLMIEKILQSKAGISLKLWNLKEFFTPQLLEVKNVEGKIYVGENFAFVENI